jgi:hypothetical protein
MILDSALALWPPAQATSATVTALTFTAAIIIPAGFLLSFLKEKMAAVISRHHSQ